MTHQIKGSNSDLEITNICHFFGLSNQEKLAQFEVVRENIDKRIADFDQIGHYERIITNFLTLERDKYSVTTQADSLRILASKIFNNLNSIMVSFIPKNSRKPKETQESSKKS